MDKQQKNFIGLLSAAIGGKPFVPDAPDYPGIIALAQYHGVTNLLSYAIAPLPKELQPEEALKKYLKRHSYASTTREVLQEKEFLLIREAFSKESIRALPLKGAVIKHLYPRPEMRHMSDVDLLISPEDRLQVRGCLEQLGFRAERFGLGDTDDYFGPNGIKYELHHDLSEESFNNKSCSFVSGLLALSEGDPKQGFLTLSNEAHYVYVLCHFIKHFLNGGIGVRQVMDVYLCRREWSFDEPRLQQLLKDLELGIFAENLEQLASHWFNGGEENEITRELGDYIMGSGVFGREDQKVADRLLKGENGKNRRTYLRTRLFPSYKTMCFYYPSLKKLPILLPFYWVWRILYALLFRRGKLRNELATVGETDQSALHRRASFYQRCGLNVYKDEKG